MQADLSIPDNRFIDLFNLCNALIKADYKASLNEDLHYLLISIPAKKKFTIKICRRGHIQALGRFPASLAEKIINELNAKFIKKFIRGT